MDYTAARATFFTPPSPGYSTPAVVADATAARRLRAAAEPLAMHAVWSSRVNEVLAEHGFDFLSSYVWGRAAALGEPSAAVVASAFAWFEPGFISWLYDEGRTLLPREELLALRTEAAVTGLTEILADVDVDEVTDVADTLHEALARADAVGRPLFAGLRDLPRPNEPIGRLWRACDLLREFRGDSHIAAAATTGLSAVQMNILTELWLGMPMLSYTATRGWDEPAMEGGIAGPESRGWRGGEQLTDAGAAVRREIEERTDAAEQGLLARLDGAIDVLADRLNGWGQLCIDAGAFPPDPFKRWAG